MKGVSLAIETIIYLILAIMVLAVLLLFFLTQAGPAQDQYKLEADRNRYCGTYTSLDFGCAGKGGQPVDSASQDLRKNIGTTCKELSRRFGFAYPCSDIADLTCIKQCCLTCPK